MSRSILSCACALLLVSQPSGLSSAWAKEKVNSDAGRDIDMTDDDDDADDEVDADDDDDLTEEIEEALTKRVSFEFDNATLRDVSQFIADSQGIRVVVDHRRLEADGISMDHSINFRIQGVKLESALRLMLRPEGIDFAIRDEVLLITNKEEAAATVTTKVYPVGELLGASAAGQSEKDLVSLMRTIRATIEPDSWDEVGGPGVLAACEKSRALICLQNRTAHQKIEQLLEELQEACDE